MPKAYIEPEEVTKMEGATTCLRDRLLIRVIFWLGCRVSEALGIKVPEDIDFERAIITIKHLKVRLQLSCPSCGTRLSKTAQFCPGCGQKVTEARQKALENSKQRQVPIDRETMDLLRDFIQRDHTRGLLFKIGRTRAFSIIRDAGIKAGLGKLINPETGKLHYISPHKLRDAFAIMAVKDNDSMDSIRSLQEQLGHASISTTMKYRKVAGEEQRKWYDRTIRRPGRQLTLPDK
jgi:integrase/recombinase XerD